MSSPHRENRTDRVELEPVTCWPLIYGAAGFLAAVALCAGGVWAFNALRPAAVEAPAAVEKETPFAFTPVAKAGPEVPAPAPFREERQVVKREAPKAEMQAPWPKYAPEYPPLPNTRPEKAARPAAPAKPPRPPTALARRAKADEGVLADELLKLSREIDLEVKTASTAKKKSTEARKSPVPVVKDDKSPLTAGIRSFLAKRDDLKGLPLAAEKDCLTSKDAAKQLDTISADVRQLQARRDSPRASTTDHPMFHGLNQGMADYLTKGAKKFAEKPHAVGPLMQMFQAEAYLLRYELAETLSAIEGKEATAALARLAAFDLSAQVRENAIKRLKKRKAADARPILLAALRHPWATAADHAAHALVELDDRAAMGPMKKMLELPPPDAPFQQGGKWVKREVVRVNHLRNCFLCHASEDHKTEGRSALVTAPVPEPGRALPAVYYGSRRRSSGPSVRADVVYLRQDFSVMHTVKDASPWPEVQRFDYLVRNRPLTLKEQRELTAGKATDKPADYPQLRAVKDALAELSRRKAPPEPEK